MKRQGDTTEAENGKKKDIVGSLVSRTKKGVQKAKNWLIDDTVKDLKKIATLENMAEKYGELKDDLNNELFRRDVHSVIHDLDGDPSILLYNLSMGGKYPDLQKDLEKEYFRMQVHLFIHGMEDLPLEEVAGVVV